MMKHKTGPKHRDQGSSRHRNPKGFSRGVTTTVVLLAAAVWFGCAAEPRETVLLDTFAGVYVDGAVDSLPKVEYPRDGVTLNDRCPVRKVKLNRRMPPMYVNNFPVGFC